MRFEVGNTDHTARGVGEIFDTVRQFARVKGFGAGVGDQFQGDGVIGQAHHLAGVGGHAVVGEGLEPGAVFGGLVGLGVSLSGHAPEPCQGWPDRIPGFGITDGGLEKLGELEAAEALVQVAPGGGRAGHRDRQPAPVRHGLVAPVPQQLPGQAGRGAPRAVQAVQALPIPDQREGIPANAVAGGLEHGQGNRGGQGGVHGVAAPVEHLESRLGRQGLAGGNRATGAQDGGALRRVRVVAQGLVHGGSDEVSDSVAAWASLDSSAGRIKGVR